MYINILPNGLVKALVDRYENKDIFLVKDSNFNVRKENLLYKKWVKQDEFLRFIEETKNSEFTYFLRAKRKIDIITITQMLVEKMNRRLLNNVLFDIKFKKIFYIKFNSFSYKSLEEIKSGILNCTHDEIIIDLRNNGGGNFEVCTQIIDLFLPKMNYMELFYINNIKKSLSSSIDHKEFKSIYIFLSEKSASCSEIFSMVLKKWLPNVHLIGNKENPKVCTQHVIKNHFYGYTFAIADSIWKVDGEGAEKLEKYIKNDSGNTLYYNCMNDYLKRLYEQCGRQSNLNEVEDC